MVFYWTDRNGKTWVLDKDFGYIQRYYEQPTDYEPDHPFENWRTIHYRTRKKLEKYGYILWQKITIQKTTIEVWTFDEDAIEMIKKMSPDAEFHYLKSSKRYIPQSIISL
jgi:hypothetical protein